MHIVNLVCVGLVDSIASMDKRSVGKEFPIDSVHDS